MTDPHAPALSPRRDDEASSRAEATDLYDRHIPSADRDGRGRWRPGRRGGCLLLLAALAIAGAGHWAWWYRDRAHEMAPSKSRLLGEATLPVRLWLPYPHQNLGALGKAVEHPREVLAAASRLAGLPEPAIPQLGAFGIPAARELLVEASRDGRTVRAAIRLYPATAVLIRIAGTVARNRWLAGGEVKVNGAPAEVRWDGLMWRLRSMAAESATNGGAAATAGEDHGAGATRAPSAGTARTAPHLPPDDSRPALALIELTEPVPPLAAGTYPLRREGDDLALRIGAPLPDPPNAGPPPRVMLVWLQRRAERSEALLMIEADRQGLLAGLPAAAAWAQPSGAVDVLPGGHLLRQLAGVRPAAFGGGELAASESSAAARARELASTWLPLASGRSFPPLALGGWLAIAPAAEQTERIHELLEEIPILGAAEAQRWGDVATVLRAAHGYRTLSCWLAEDGSAGELRLHR
ncbi:MAG TPA: hypothetical protein VN811_13445 [Thermoanaerobaculia bacterium]|nr:hypothetical protein [Thermoanaerobaculia bacterium]